MKANPDEVSKMLGLPTPLVERGNPYHPSSSMKSLLSPSPDSVPEAFVITKESKHKRDLSKALKEVEREEEKRDVVREVVET